MLKLVLGLALAGLVNGQDAVTTISGSVNGIVYFTKTSNGIQISGNITGLKEGLHGFHIHSLGDLSKGCASTGSHFNPHKVNHGAQNASVRHVGDLGNIVADTTGVAVIDILDTIISLDGDHNILGRSVVVHEDPDDLGLGNQTDSLTTGHAGARLGCGIIGTLSEQGGSYASAPFLALIPAIIISIIARLF